MTPEQKIKREILLIIAKEHDDIVIDPNATGEDIDSQYDELYELDLLNDTKADFRRGQVETRLPSGFSSRHYEVKEVAAKCCDGTWVGWPYWFGGGKHGEPGSMEWMEYAYDLEVTEKMMLVQEFKEVKPD